MNLRLRLQVLSTFLQSPDDSQKVATAAASTSFRQGGTSLQAARIVPGTPKACARPFAVQDLVLRILGSGSGVGGPGAWDSQVRWFKVESFGDTGPDSGVWMVLTSFFCGSSCRVE